MSSMRAWSAPGVQFVVALFETTRAHWRKTDRQQRWFRFAAIFLSADTLVLVGLALWNLWSAWQTGDWNSYWNSVHDLPRLMTVPLLFALFVLAPTKPVRETVIALRHAAATGEERLAPPAETQPAPLTGAEMPIGETRIGPLRGSHDGTRAGLMVAGAIVFLLVAMGAGILDVAGIRWLADGLGSGPEPPAWAAIGIATILGLVALGTLVLLRYGVVFILWAPKLRRGLYVTADEQGVRWEDTRWRTGRHSIAWHDAESFVIMAAHPQGEPEQRAYALNAADEVLFWTVGGYASAEDKAVAQRLSRLVATRTHLPLRDLSRAVEALAQAAMRADGIVNQQGRLGNGAVALPAGIYTPPGAVHQRRWTRALIWGVVALGLLLYPGAWGLQRYQEYLHGGHARPHQALYTWASDLIGGSIADTMDRGEKRG